MRFALGLAAVSAAAAVATAGPKRKVRIETTPPGASVYIDTVEDGEKCKTPCSIEIAPDETMILRADGYKPVVESITIGRSEKAPYKRSYPLAKSVGTISVKGPKGASVVVDDEDKGHAPVDIEVDASSPHSVVMKVDNKNIYAESIEVAAGDTVDVVGSAKPVGGNPRGTDPPIDDGPKPPAVRNKAPAPPRAGAIFSLSAAGSVGFRDFAYKDPDTTINPNLNPEKEYGQITAGAQLVLWPGNLAGVKILRGLSLLARYEHNVNAQVVEQDQMATEATTFWRNLEVSARQRWTISGAAAVEVGAGYLLDEHSFGGNIADIQKVPDVSYESVRIGLRGSLLVGKLEPYASVESRIVLSGGALEDRFPGASASGFAAGLGVAATFGNIGARLEGSLVRYSWTFADDGTTGTTGATDSIKFMSFTLGYAY